jgi:hypothetical protein
MMLLLCVQVLQALAVAVIGAVGVGVAFQQMSIARVKLQHDLYDRRYAVFDAVRALLNEAISSQIVSPETFRMFALKTADAEFLFDDGLAAYLREMREHAFKAQSIYSTIQPMEPGDQKAAAFRAAAEHTTWLNAQIDGLAARFRPFLMLEKRKRRA